MKLAVMFLVGSFKYPALMMNLFTPLLVYFFKDILNIYLYIKSIKYLNILYTQ